MQLPIPSRLRKYLDVIKEKVRGTASGGTTPTSESAVSDGLVGAADASINNTGDGIPAIDDGPTLARRTSFTMSPSTLRTGSSGIAQLDASRGNALEDVPHYNTNAISERSSYINKNGGRHYQIDNLGPTLSAQASCPISPSGEESLRGMGGQFKDNLSAGPLVLPTSVTTRGIRDRIRSVRLKSALRNGKDYFIPYPELLDIFNQEVVFHLLSLRFDSMQMENGGQKGDNYSPDEIKGFAAKICPGVVKLDSQAYYRAFATVFMMDKPELILDLITNEVDDARLPLYVKGNPKGLYIGNNPEFKSCNLQWSYDDVSDFEQHQDLFTAPFFSPTIDNGKKRVPHFELWPRVVLPFVLVDDSPGPIGAGSHGQVIKCELHEAHHSLQRYTNTEGSTANSSDGPQLVAVKILKNNASRLMFDKESYILSRLTQSVTPGIPGYDHIAKILVSFEIPVPGLPSEYYLVFPLADANLEQFMKSKPDLMTSMPAGQVTAWLAKQCHGLADALYAFHKSPYRRQSDMDPRTEGLHCDIKPGNILWYRNWHRGTDSLGVLQITDFGLASYHHPESASYVDHPAVQLTFRPPEPELNITSGPSFDIWSLGCLYFDLLVWMLEGYAKLEQFRLARLSQSMGQVKTDTFYSLTEKDGSVKVSIKHVVFDKAKELHAHPQVTEFTHKLISLIMNKMLVVITRKQSALPVRRRINSQDLAADMVKICDEKGGSFNNPNPYQGNNIPTYNQYVTEIQTTFKQIRVEVLAERI